MWNRIIFQSQTDCDEHKKNFSLNLPLKIAPSLCFSFCISLLCTHIGIANWNSFPRSWRESFSSAGIEFFHLDTMIFRIQVKWERPKISERIFHKNWEWEKMRKFSKIVEHEKKRVKYLYGNLSEDRVNMKKVEW